jgi:hypothetical protein
MGKTLSLNFVGIGLESAGGGLQFMDEYKKIIQKQGNLNG